MQSFVACETFSDCDRPWLWPCQINMRSSLEWKHKTVTKPWSSFAAYFVVQPWSVARHESIPKPNRMNRAAVQQKVFPPIGIKAPNLLMLVNWHCQCLPVSLGDKWAFWFATGENDEARWHQKISVAHCANKPGASTRTHRRKLYSKKERLSAKWCCKVSIFGQQKHCFGKSWCTSVSSIQLGQRSIVLKPVFCWHFDVSVLKNI